MPASPKNPEAYMRRAYIEEEIARILDPSNTSFPVCKQARIDWINGVRRWLPVKAGTWFYWRDVMPPLFIAQGDLVVCSEPAGDGLYCAAHVDVDGNYWFALVSLKDVTNLTYRSWPHAGPEMQPFESPEDYEQFD